MDRTFCYLWEDVETDVPAGECKFGERFVFEGQDPMTECCKRIRDSLAVRKDRYDEGKIRVIAIWDVSVWAMEVGCNKQHGKMDDHIRALIGFRKGNTGEVHTIAGDEMAIRVNKVLSSHGQPLIEAGLSSSQYSTAVNVLDAINKGKKIILAELCARFGKTMWSGVLAKENEVQVTVIASYVLTSFTSFAKDLSSFEQFKDFVHVDTKDPDYQKMIEEAIYNDKPVLAYLSLHESVERTRQKRMDFLYGLDVTRMTIVDEADFGAHTANQALPLIDAVGDDVVVLMTGTDSDRAAAEWTPDHFVSVTYPELLIDKKRALEQLTQLP